MRNSNDKYKIYKTELLRLNGFDMMSNDTEVIDRIFNLLTENLQIGKIEGIISNTEIVKYGGDIEEKQAKRIFYNIKNWWETNGL